MVKKFDMSGSEKSVSANLDEKLEIVVKYFTEYFGKEYADQIRERLTSTPYVFVSKQKSNYDTQDEMLKQAEALLKAEFFEEIGFKEDSISADGYMDLLNVISRPYFENQIKDEVLSYSSFGKTLIKFLHKENEWNEGNWLEKLQQGDTIKQLMEQFKNVDQVYYSKYASILSKLDFSNLEDYKKTLEALKNEPEEVRNRAERVFNLVARSSKTSQTEQNENLEKFLRETCSINDERIETSMANINQVIKTLSIGGMACLSLDRENNLCILPYDAPSKTMTHEFTHVISCYGDSESSYAGGKSGLKLDSMFININEIVTDYFAEQINKQMEADGHHMGTNNNEKTTYSFLFKWFGDLIEKHKKQFVDAYMGESLNPITDVIGFDNFVRLNEVCNEMLDFYKNYDNVDELFVEVKSKKVGHEPKTALENKAQDILKDLEWAKERIEEYVGAKSV